MLLVRWNLPKLVAALFVPVLCCILTAGLWPFGDVPNEVSWLSKQTGVRFANHGTILSRGEIAEPDAQGCTVELWMRPSSSDDSSTVLAFYGPNGATGVSLHQSLTDLRLNSHENGGKLVRRYINDVFYAQKAVFVTVVFGPRSAAVHLNGGPAQQVAGLNPAAPVCSGRFVVGDSPIADNTWQGELYGLAIYRRALATEEVALSHRSWIASKRPAELAAGGPKALYLFDEGKGDLVRDHAAGVELYIPARYVIAHPTFLGAPWRSYDGDWNDVQDVVINIAGFAPFGFTFCALVSLSSTRWSSTVAVFAGLLVSLTIEVTQAYMPTRNSDLSDVITNTIGTCLGVFVYQKLRSTRFWANRAV
jgi:VanZ family protein